MPRFNNSGRGAQAQPLGGNMPGRKRQKPRQSPLRREITQALALRGNRAVGLRVSISKPEWFQPSGRAKDEFWVKWFSWRLVSRNGHNVTRPKYGMLHGGLANRTLLRSMRQWFPSHRCVIDNKIVLS